MNSELIATAKALADGLDAVTASGPVSACLSELALQHELLQKEVGQLKAEPKPGQPAQPQKPPDGYVVVARAVLKKLGIGDDVIDTIAGQPTPQPAQQGPVDAVLLDDMVEGTHPSYGRGLFTTDNCVKQLYTAPPQRKPLTDEELRNVLRNTNHMIRNAMHGPFWPELEQACRATEAAHGITAQPARPPAARNEIKDLADAALMNEGSIASLQEQPEPKQYTTIGQRKLDDLRKQGFVVDGVAIARTSDDGTVTRGAVTAGGMVLWWHPNA